MRLVSILLCFAMGCRHGSAPRNVEASDPLPAWRDAQNKRALISFVQRVSTPGADFVPPDARVATFDNDGTLWTEQPMYVQLAFTLDRVHVLAPSHPEWANTEPFRSVLANDLGSLQGAPQRDLEALMSGTHTGNTSADFSSIVNTWMRDARHPRFHRRYSELVYQPMLELLAYLRANGFQTYIVTGGGAEFVRPWSEAVYGVTPERVVGSRVRLRYEMRGDAPVLARLPEVDFVADGPGKPVGIEQQIGRRPILAVGNSDGDFEMLEWTCAGDGPRLAAILHHTDAEREWAYDRASKVGHLARALDEAPQRGWLVIDMRRDWLTIYASAARPSTMAR